MTPLPLLQGLPPELQRQAAGLLESDRALKVLATRYPEAHRVNSNKQLFNYVQELKSRHMQSSPALGKVQFDSRACAAERALGLNITRQRVHGRRLHKRRELLVAGVFKELPAAFLRMIVVHELAHLKHHEHDAAFYKLCCHMEPEYYQLEFDLRLWLSAIDATNANCNSIQ